MGYPKCLKVVGQFRPEYGKQASHEPTSVN
jgi:hypothetical protein